MKKNKTKAHKSGELGTEQFPFFHMLKSQHIFKVGPRAKNWLKPHLEEVGSLS